MARRAPSSTPGGSGEGGEQTPTPTDRELLVTYAPILQYHSKELYYADSARSFVENVFAGGPLAPYGNVLRRDDGTIIASASGDPSDRDRLTLEFLAAADGSYPNGQPVRSDDYLDATTRAYLADARRQHERPDVGNVIYGTVRPGTDGRRWLQYWFFFYYNDKAVSGFGLHEGDWEGIQIRVDPDGTPEEVTYSQHRHGERADWVEVELDEETGAPVVYVALGSHASFLRAGSYRAPGAPDLCDADGARVRPTLELIDEDGPSWSLWPGRWGRSKKSGWISFPSPDSPRTQGRWRDPNEFHREAREFEERRGDEEEIVAPPPTVVAVRDAETIRIELTTAPDTAAKLVVLAVIDEEPLALEYDLSELPESEPITLEPIEQGTPLTLEQEEDDAR